MSASAYQGHVALVLSRKMFLTRAIELGARGEGHSHGIVFRKNRVSEATVPGILSANLPSSDKVRVVARHPPGRLCFRCLARFLCCPIPW